MSQPTIIINFECSKNGFNSAQTEFSRLPPQYSSLRPDHYFISGPNSTFHEPRDWLLYPTGIIFKIDAKKLPDKSGRGKRKRSISPTAGPSLKIFEKSIEKLNEILENH